MKRSELFLTITTIYVLLPAQALAQQSHTVSDTGLLMGSFDKKVIKLPSSFLVTSATEIVRKFQSLGLRSTDGVTLHAIPEDNSIIATYKEVSDITRLREIIRLFDVHPAQMEIRAEATLTFTDSVGHKQRTQLRTQGRTFNERKLRLKTSLGNGLTAATPAALQSGSSDVRISPVVNGDETISLDVDWSLDLDWRVAGAPRPVPWHNDFSGAGRVPNGKPLTLTRSAFQVGSGRSAATVEIVLKLTSEILKPPRSSENPLLPSVGPARPQPSP